MCIRDSLSTELRVIIPPDLAKENRFCLDARTVVHIDKVLDSLFNDFFLLYMDDNCKEKGDIKNSIYKFRDNYNLTEDDIQFETLKKIHYRARLKTPKKNKHNFRAKLITQKPHTEQEIGQVAMFN